MLRLLSVHVTSVLFLVQFNKFPLTMGFVLLELHALTSRPFLCALGSSLRVTSATFLFLASWGAIPVTIIISHFYLASLPGMEEG